MGRWRTAWGNIMKFLGIQPMVWDVDPAAKTRGSVRPGQLWTKPLRLQAVDTLRHLHVDVQEWFLLAEDARCTLGPRCCPRDGDLFERRRCWYFLVDHAFHYSAERFNLWTLDPVSLVSKQWVPTQIFCVFLQLANDPILWILQRILPMPMSPPWCRGFCGKTLPDGTLWSCEPVWMFDIGMSKPKLPSGKLTVCYWTWPFSSLIYPWKMVMFHSFL